MQAPRETSRAPSFRAHRLVSVLSLLAAGCHAEASIKASTSDEPRAEVSDTTTAPDVPETTATTAPAPAAVPAPVAAPATPPADACPLHCYEARGSEALDLRGEEITQLRSALEPVIGRMRQCVAPEEWRRHGWSQGGSLQRALRERSATPRSSRALSHFPARLSA